MMYEFKFLLAAFAVVWALWWYVAAGRAIAHSALEVSKKNRLTDGQTLAALALSLAVFGIPVAALATIPASLPFVVYYAAEWLVGGAP